MVSSFSIDTLRGISCCALTSLDLSNIGQGFISGGMHADALTECLLSLTSLRKLKLGFVVPDAEVFATMRELETLHVPGGLSYGLITRIPTLMNIRTKDIVGKQKTLRLRSIDVTSPDQRNLAALLRNVPSLRHLRLSLESGISKTVVKAILSGSFDLQTLQFRVSEKSVRLTILSRLAPRLKSLTKLTVASTKIFPVEELQSLKALPLQELNFFVTRSWGDARIAFEEVLPATLEVLRIPDYGIPSVGLFLPNLQVFQPSHWEASKDCPRMSSLITMRCDPLVQFPDVIDSMASLTLLKTWNCFPAMLESCVSLKYLRIPSFCCNHLKNMHELEVLACHHNSSPFDTGIFSPSIASMRHLRVLSIARMPVHRNDLIHLPRSIEILNMSYCEIDTDTVVTAVGHLPRLRILVIVGVAISPMHLLEHCAHLERIEQESFDIDEYFPAVRYDLRNLPNFI